VTIVLWCTLHQIIITDILHGFFLKYFLLLLPVQGVSSETKKDIFLCKFLFLFNAVQYIIGNSKNKSMLLPVMLLNQKKNECSFFTFREKIYRLLYSNIPTYYLLRFKGFQKNPSTGTSYDCLCTIIQYCN